LDQAHAEDAGQALRKLALLDTEAIPLDLLGTDEKKAVLVLQEHSLVTVDDTGCAAIHAVTQLVVRDWITSSRAHPRCSGPCCWPHWWLCWHQSCSSLIMRNLRRFSSDIGIRDMLA